MLTFTADGRPRSKGSHIAQRVPGQRRLRAAAVQEDDLAKWTGTIRNAATQALVGPAVNRWGNLDGSIPADAYPRAWPGSVLVLARFRLVRPLRLADTLDYEPATVVPDGDKLERALWDALTGLAFADDRQVIGWSGLKVYAGPLERAGVDCRVLALDEHDTAAGAGHVPTLLARAVQEWQ
jgi:hypothetical protein